MLKTCLSYKKKIFLESGKPTAINQNEAISMMQSSLQVVILKWLVMC